MVDADAVPGGRLIAFYLPQFHPIPENDKWWGKGFTEWTNVTKAQPLFGGHYQPHLPADLGFYDLRLPEAREAQVALAREYGIHGFCYYHYWFNGRRILERPFESVLTSGRPDFPFCLCWANENWTRRWDGMDSEILLEQQYSPADDLAHIRILLPAFADDRYIRVDGKPLFLVYRLGRLPDPRSTAERWRREAERAGLGGLYLVQVESFPDEQCDPRDCGFDAALEFQPMWWAFSDVRVRRRKWWHFRHLGMHEAAFYHHSVYRYADLVARAIAAHRPQYPWIRCICPSWDNSARREEGATIFHGSTPALYQTWLEALLQQTAKSNGSCGDASSMVFINAWNEWAEGNHLEPCQKWGRGYLEATREALRRSSTRVHEYAERNLPRDSQKHSTHVRHRMPAVSVIITTYNQEQYIAQTIASALAQTFTDHEIIVVDDGSTDNTSTVVASFGERVKYIRQANQGVASSRNTGILQARGDLLAFLDGDDLWEPRKLEVQVGIARLYPDAALIAVDGVQFSHGTILSPSLLAPSVLDCFSGRDSVACVECYPGLIEGNVIYTTSQVMVRRGIFDEVGLSDGTFPLVNDYDLYLRIADRYPFAFSGEKLTKWRYHEGSASGPAGLRHLRWAEDEIGILRKQLGVAPAAYIPAIRRALKRKVYTTSRAAYQNRRQVGVRSTVQYLWRIACKGRIYRWWILLCLMALALPKPVIKRLIVVERLLPGAVRRLA